MRPDWPSSISGSWRRRRNGGPSSESLALWSPPRSVARAQAKPALVELGDDFVERLLTEVGDGQQVVLGLLQQLADRVDLCALEAVARPLRELEIFDRQIEVG